MPPMKKRYDNVEILDMADGTEITGHDAVQAHFDREQQMLDEHGMTITFQVYRIDLNATTLEDLQGEKLTEIGVDGGFVSGTDTVTEVRERVLATLREKPHAGRDPGGLPEVKIDEADHVTLFFGGHPMRDDELFYADHFMMLPAWVQVCLHRCDSEKFAGLIASIAGKNDDGA